MQAARLCLKQTQTRAIRHQVINASCRSANTPDCTMVHATLTRNAGGSQQYPVTAEASACHATITAHPVSSTCSFKEPCLLTCILAFASYIIANVWIYMSLMSLPPAPLPPSVEETLFFAVIRTCFCSSYIFCGMSGAWGVRGAYKAAGPSIP
jgi:hypothetical protein